MRVNSKAKKQWKELALDATTKEIVGVYIGDRSRESALKLWHSLPPVYHPSSLLYRFLGVLSRNYPRKTSQSCGERHW